LDDVLEADFGPASKSAIKCRIRSALTQAEAQSNSQLIFSSMRQFLRRKSQGGRHANRATKSFRSRSTEPSAGFLEAPEDSPRTMSFASLSVLARIESKQAFHFHEADFWGVSEISFVRLQTCGPHNFRVVR
jgi:hypothetical protein